MSVYEVIGIFCHMALLLLFVASSVQKLSDHTAFERSVKGFAIVPSGWIVPLSWLFLVGECLTVVGLLGGLLWGGALRVAGVLVALILLILFSGALISVIARGLHVPCGCFGAHNDRPVSWLHLLRNASMLVCGIVALSPTVLTASLWHYPILVNLLTLLTATTFVIISTHLDEITSPLRQGALS
jgi:hypothetical protein